MDCHNSTFAPPSRPDGTGNATVNGPSGRPPPPAIPAPPGLNQPQSASAPPGLGQPQAASSQRPPPPPLPPSADLDEDDDEDEEEVRTNKGPNFLPHMEADEAADRCREGKLTRGVLRVSATKPSNAWVRPDGAKSKDDKKDIKDIVVKGRTARNRAVHGDIVYVEILDDERGVDGRGEGESEDEDPTPLHNRSTIAVESDDEIASDSDSDEEIVFKGRVMAPDPDDAATPKAKQPVNRGFLGMHKKKRSVNGRVVAIAEAKGRDRVIVCTLHPFHRQWKDGERGEQDDQQVRESDRVLRAKPTDSRMPWILIQINDVTRGVLKIPGRINKYELWPIQILKWKDNSHLPLGRLKGQCLGLAGDLEAEVKHALIENELDDHDVDFEDDLLDEVESVVEEAKKEFRRECGRRDDLQGKRIFTIDPATAKDLDDAIHVDVDRAKRQVEIGVHIADVGHFVKLGSVCDTEATRRTTSVYLIDRVLPMLPHALCNHLCSLNPNEGKLAFSAFFRLSLDTGELIEDPEPWFKKTVIKSCCRLNYEEVQDVLDGIPIEKPVVYGNHNWEQIEDDIFLLYDVCGKVRTGRMEGGAMSITKTKMIFHTRESEDGVPTGYHLESHSASHWIIEELMLLANRCVASHLAHSRLQNDGSVLRNHKAPDPKKAEVLDKLLKNNLNIREWDSHSAGALYRSCQRIYRKYGPILGQCVEMMLMRAGMQQAEYFVFDGEEDPHHFALNFEYYTHFTSPIRRYPDVMVHRVLFALISDNANEFHDKEAASDLVKTCNDKKQASRKCQEQLDRSVFCVFLRRRKEWFYTIGNVLGFAESKPGSKEADFVTVYCSQLGKEKKARLCTAAELSAMCLYTEGVDDELIMPTSWKFRGKGYLELDWPCQDHQRKTRQKLQVLSCVPVVVIPTDTVPIDFEIFIVSPLHPRYGEVNVTITDDAAKGFEWTDDAEEDGVDVVHTAE